jgi:hypothetical protein
MDGRLGEAIAEACQSKGRSRHRRPRDDRLRALLVMFLNAHHVLGAWRGKLKENDTYWLVWSVANTSWLVARNLCW